MKLIAAILTATLVCTLALSGCAAGTDSTTTVAVVNLLAAIMGVTSDQATAGAGSLLGLASERLTPQEYAQVAASIPGSATLVQKAGQMTGLGNHFGTMANVTTGLAKVGLTPTQVHTMATNLPDIAARTGGEAVRGLLLRALK